MTEHTTVEEESRTTSERMFQSNQEIRDLWSIDPHRDPYKIPLEELDPSHPSLFKEDTVYPYFERLRKEDPVHFTASSMFGPYWSVTKYKHVMEVEKNYEAFSSDQKYGGIQLSGVPYDDGKPDPQFNLPMFIMMDPPKHRKQRNTVQPMFNARPLNQLEPLIRERAGAILDSLPIGYEFDWVTSVSIDLTAQMLATLFDVPQKDRMKLIYWSDVVQHATDPLRFTSFADALTELWKVHEYFSEVFERAKQESEQKNNLIWMLAHGEATRDMPPNELLGNLLLLIVAGNDTTRNSISGGVLFLNQFPDEYRKLNKNPELIPGMVSEIIRFQSSVAYMARTATRDYELGGKLIRKGDRLAMWYISANRDEEEISDANSFVIDRPEVRNHLGFGFGIHHCLGFRLAELQLRVLWEEIQKRFERIEVVGKPEYGYTSFLHSLRHLPVKVHIRN